MNLDYFVVLDAASGTFFSASDAYLLDTRKLTTSELDALNEGTDSERSELAERCGTGLGSIAQAACVNQLARTDTMTAADAPAQPEILPPTKDEELCSNCYYRDWGTETCRRHAPQATFAPTNFYVDEGRDILFACPTWPETMETDWCGEWRPA